MKRALITGITVPAIVDHDGGVSLMESGAILMYLAEKTGQFMPSSGAAKWQVVEWLMMQMGSVGPMLGQTHHFLFYNKGKDPYAEERYSKENARIYGVLNKRLGEHQYLAGDYSIADIATWPWIARHPRQEFLSASPWATFLNWMSSRARKQYGPKTHTEIRLSLSNMLFVT